MKSGHLFCDSDAYSAYLTGIEANKCTVEPFHSNLSGTSHGSHTGGILKYNKYPSTRVFGVIMNALAWLLYVPATLALALVPRLAAGLFKNPSVCADFGFGVCIGCCIFASRDSLFK